MPPLHATCPWFLNYLRGRTVRQILFFADPCQNRGAMVWLLHIDFREVSMRADQVEASWDPGKNKWLFRIRIGEEVIRRYCDAPKNAEDATLTSVAQTTLLDEGYDADPKELKIRR